MSLIPSTAIGAALTPVQRSTNDLIQARKVQSAKDYHHSEEVEELDDTAVNSIDDGQQGGARRGQEEKPGSRKKREEERVDIESLKSPAGQGSKVPAKAAPSRLDISA